MKYSFIKNLLQLDSNYCKNIFISILILIIGSCRHEKPTYTVNFSNTDPLIDGSIDTIWNNAEAGFIHQYYGEDVKDSMDFSAYFKILHNKTYLFILVDITDQVKYTHPKPQDRVDKKVWHLSDYDRVNLTFDSNYNRKIETDHNDIGVSMNYGVDSVITYNIDNGEVYAQQKDTDLGYVLEFKIPLKYFKRKKVPFQILITDHDKKFHIKDFDVYGRWESEFGWGNTGYFEGLSKRYGIIYFE